LREHHDVRARAVDGARQGAWVVLDFFDVIVHVMRQDVRDRYDLDGLWSDALKLKVGKPKAIKTGKAKPRTKKVTPKAARA
jgi:ribosome-associated protein